MLQTYFLDFKHMRAPALDDEDDLHGLHVDAYLYGCHQLLCIRAWLASLEVQEQQRYHIVVVCILQHLQLPVQAFLQARQLLYSQPVVAP